MINGFPALTLEHFYVKFGDSSCIGFSDIVRNNIRTDKRGKNRTPTTTIGVHNHGQTETKEYYARMCILRCIHLCNCHRLSVLSGTTQETEG